MSTLFPEPGQVDRVILTARLEVGFLCLDCSLFRLCQQKTLRYPGVETSGWVHVEGTFPVEPAPLCSLAVLSFLPK